MVRFDLYVTSQQREEIRIRSEQTGLTAAELLRRMMDYCSQETVMNQLVPNMSGYLSIGRK